MKAQASPSSRVLDQHRHLQSILTQYVAYFNGRRPHRSGQLHPPRPDHPVADLSQERIKRRPVLGGLLNECEQAA
jgi:putative transposase